MSILRIEDASVYYEDFQALYDINLKIEEGEIFACIGANGAGKSTLLKTVSGLMTPRRGRILFDGQPIDHMPAHERVGRGIATVPEGRRVFPSLTVHENLLIGAYRNRKGPWTADSIYELFPLLAPLAKRQASALSGGEQQALAIGRALMANPRLPDPAEQRLHHPGGGARRTARAHRGQSRGLFPRGAHRSSGGSE